MRRIAGLLMLLSPCLGQAQDAAVSSSRNAGEDKVAAAQADQLAGKKPVRKSGRKSVSAPVKGTPKAVSADEGDKADGAGASSEPAEESVQLKGLRG